jgi:hypothetical protein
MHLNIEALVDIAEGARVESSAPHLAACEHCREQLRDLRAMVSEARAVDVPEPSPLFWDHLSSRVREAVSEDAAPRRSRLDRVLWKRTVLEAMAAAAVAVLIVVVVRSFIAGPNPASTPPTVSVADAGAATELLGDVPADDVSLTLVAGLTDDQDLDTVREAGLAPRGTAEHAVIQMSDDDLRELRRLLKEELARSGA